MSGEERQVRPASRWSIVNGVLRADAPEGYFWYPAADETGLTLACGRCGAYVSLVALHQGWHKSLDASR